MFTFFIALHNAWQLSSALKDTLLSIIDQGLQLIGIKDEEGNDLNAEELIGETIEGWIAKLIRVENLNEAKAEWARYNRIVNTGAQIISNIQGITDGIANVVDLSASYTGKIGNALLKSKVIADDSYKWMAEKVSAATGRRKKIQQLIEGIQSVQEVADNAESILSSANSVVQEATDLKKNIDEFKKEVANTKPEANVENEPTKTQQEAEETTSNTPEIKQEDKEKAQ